MDISSRLFAIAGEVEKFQETGGHVSPDTIRWLAENLNVCGTAAMHQAEVMTRMEEQLDSLVEQNIAQARMPPRGVFLPRVIVGGRA